MSKRGLIAKIADYPNELLQPEPVKIAKGLPLTINASIGRGKSMLQLKVQQVGNSDHKGYQITALIWACRQIWMMKGDEGRCRDVRLVEASAHFRRSVRGLRGGPPNCPLID